MLATLVLLTLLFVVATTGASYYGFLNDDDANPFLADGRWISDAHNQVVHEHKAGSEFLADDVNNESRGFLKASDLNKSKGRNKAVKNHQFAPFDEKHLKTWNKMKDAKNKNKKPKNMKPKNSKQLQISTPQNDDPIQNSRNQKIKNFDERVRFIQSLDKNAQQMKEPYHNGLYQPRIPPLRQNEQDFFYYPPPGFYQHYNLPQFMGRTNYQNLPASYQRALLPYILYPHHSPYPPNQSDNQFTAEGEKISMALVKAITDYLKATGDAKGLTKVVQALTAFNEIFTSPTYYGPLMDGYKKFLEKISAHSFLKSLNDEHPMNIPRIANENHKKMDFQKHGRKHLSNLSKKSDTTGLNEEEKLSKAIGDYLSTKKSTLEKDKNETKENQ